MELLTRTPTLACPCGCLAFSQRSGCVEREGRERVCQAEAVLSFQTLRSHTVFILPHSVHWNQVTKVTEFSDMF